MSEVLSRLVPIARWVLPATLIAPTPSLPLAPLHDQHTPSDRTFNQNRSLRYALDAHKKDAKKK